MSEEVYTKLREFMDQLPAGYPSTPSGVEMKILKKLFSVEDAELTMKLSHEPENLSAIAKRLDMDESELQQKLDDLCNKGLIFRIRKGDERQYQAFQFIVGIYEFQLKHLDKEFCELFEEYMPYLGISMMNVKTSQMRVVPVESAIGKGPSVAPYNQVREMVRKEKVFAVQDCICRQEQKLLGNECDYPKESCLGFGDFGQFYIDNGWAREITMEESLELVDKAEEAGLVLSPGNSKELIAICCCCPCCCPMLKFSKLMPRPQDVLHSYYMAQIDADECSACGDCLERCPMDAMKEGDEVMEMIDGRCIGCGLCVAGCPSEAITLAVKADMEDPPDDFQEVLSRIRVERGVA